MASVTLTDSSCEEFSTLQKAVDYAEAKKNSVLKLLRDIEVDASVEIQPNGTPIEFTIDLNGHALEGSSLLSTSYVVSVEEATVVFTDSSAEKKGRITGQASAIAINNGTVTIQAGIYIANTWAVQVNGEQSKVTILEGTIRGNIGLQVNAGECEIVGGSFYGGQCSVWNSDKMTIRGGSFEEGIYNAGNGVMDFNGGKILVSGEASSNSYGIGNNGTLNLSGGSIGATDPSKTIAGVNNLSDATLNLYGDVQMNDVSIDFNLENTMNICGELSNTYSVYKAVSEDGSDSVFATASAPLTVSADNFTSGVTGYYVKAADAYTLALTKCGHADYDEGYNCKDCNLTLSAQIGDTYYVSLADALAAAAEADTEETQTVKILVNVTEDVTISGGTVILDLSGKKIMGTISVNAGDVTVNGNGGTLDGTDGTALAIGGEASVEVQGDTNIIGDIAIQNQGNLKLNGTGVVVDGKNGVFNLMGTVRLVKGELKAEEVAIINFGGMVHIGAEDGSGPDIEAETGIFNSKIVLGDMNEDAVVSINGGRISAETDIRNKTEDASGENQFLLSTVAGTVMLKGGTFIDGFTLVGDAGADVLDLLAENRAYYNGNGQRISVEEGVISLEDTVTVKMLAGEEEKTVAKNELAEYKNPAAYREAQQAELAAILQEANAAIDEAGTTEEIEAIVAAAKEALDAVKTDAQLPPDTSLSPDAPVPPTGGEGIGEVKPAPSPDTTDLTGVYVMIAMGSLIAVGMLRKGRMRKVKNYK